MITWFNFFILHFIRSILHMLKNFWWKLQIMALYLKLSTQRNQVTLSENYISTSINALQILASFYLHHSTIARKRSALNLCNGIISNSIHFNLNPSDLMMQMHTRALIQNIKLLSYKWSRVKHTFHVNSSLKQTESVSIMSIL